LEKVGLFSVIFNTLFTVKLHLLKSNTEDILKIINFSQFIY